MPSVPFSVARCCRLQPDNWKRSGLVELAEELMVKLKLGQS